VTDRVVLTTSEDHQTTCFVFASDDELPVPTEEVIRYLESEAVLARTRKQVYYVIPKMRDKGIAICVRFKGMLDELYRRDIIDALKQFFSRKGLECVVV